MNMTQRALLAIMERLQEHERRIGGSELKGKVTDVDPAKQICRIEIGKDEDGNPVLSPWATYKQTAGAMKFHNPPSVGQPMVIRSETGDIDQGMAEPFRWNDDNPSPSDDGSTHKMTFGDVTVTITPGQLRAEVGGSSVTITAEGIALEGPEVTHNGVKIDETHKHTDVEPGGSLSGPPEG
jgi:phage baseplate assembly protein gpV